MSAGDILKQLLKAYANSDSDLFRKAAMQIASNESRIGHSKLAEEIREIIGKFPESDGSKTVSIAQPRGELAGLIDGSYRTERLNDLILSRDLEFDLKRVVIENHRRSTLQQAGLFATRRILFYGPPGCGKTLSAKALAGELNLPLMNIRFDALFSRYLGATANHLRSIFDEMPRRPGVYFFDEFDAVGKSRGDHTDVGEAKRVVSSFLQLMDSDQSQSLIIAATNFERSIDSAVVRRFDSAVCFDIPLSNQIDELLNRQIGKFCSPADVAFITKKLKGHSFADVTRVCDDAMRSMILDDIREISRSALLKSLEKTVRLSNLSRSAKKSVPR